MRANELPAGLSHKAEAEATRLYREVWSADRLVLGAAVEGDLVRLHALLDIARPYQEQWRAAEVERFNAIQSAIDEAHLARKELAERDRLAVVQQGAELRMSRALTTLARLAQTLLEKYSQPDPVEGAPPQSRVFSWSDIEGLSQEFAVLGWHMKHAITSLHEMRDLMESVSKDEIATIPPPASPTTGVLPAGAPVADGLPDAPGAGGVSHSEPADG